MRGVIILLSLFCASVIGNRSVRKIALTNDYPLACFGQNVKIRITNGLFECTTQPKQYVWASWVTEWTGQQLDNCASLDIDINSKVYIITGDNYFCPIHLQIRMNDDVDTAYEAIMQNYVDYNKDTNRQAHGLTQRWPLPEGIWVRPSSEPLECPNDEHDDVCPTTEMYAYQIASRKKMNCIFECPSVKSTLFSTNYYDTTSSGFRCLAIDHNSFQYKWCCKTKSTSDGIPYCPDVVTHYNATEIEPTSIEEPELPEEPEVSANQGESQCPDSGCSLRHVKTYYDRNAAKVNQHCQINYECDFVTAISGSDSGIECRTTRQPSRKTMFCCDDPDATSSLPQCSAVATPPPPTALPATAPPQVEPSTTGGSVGNGCPQYRTQSIPSRPQKGVVRCCTMAGDRCVTPGQNNPNECIRDATIDQAEAKCTQMGMRLCTPLELSNNLCCQTGCRFDTKLTWQKSPVIASQIAPVEQTTNEVNPAPVQSGNDCPSSDPKYRLIDGQCYFFGGDWKNFADAQSSCRDQFNRQGKIFEPREENSYRAVSNAAKDVFFGSRYWIGVKKIENAFQYATGGNLAIQKWNNHQPDNRYPSKICVEVQSTYYRGELWNSVSCNGYNMFICQKR